ncbi:hypothetical protein CONPUDRAFT_157970 [Coniophora puteana RWD-64-598 SS2]|uniref:Uncharacterized protein n=1 Tax=Coniophora puteana (strain RWD-64-598) TaxID=741705 RepID=A0A5M3MDX9_CONPW|nr:uncharacterized protein CONPUDRAFT_157970 [Coniophora puteana RWD-64-598 SS2]EIW76815.1 hypothetical protein CONPUDRAFT_157970 [Coniophora puteana RWD-64-598 SS2]
MSETNPSIPLLPAPGPASLDDPNTPQVPINSAESVKLDALGPMVVNPDGTLSRIANWDKMTEEERERTLRVVTARNRIRIAQQAKKESMT